jgi:hypothetical protein
MHYFNCETCDAKIVAPYAWRSISIRCPACDTFAPLRHKLGQQIWPSGTGYEITFGDFMSLLEIHTQNQKAQSLIETLLSCTMERKGERFILLASDGLVISYEHAHLKIQADLVAQRQIYGLAMNLWR